jgi:hypothetical protein
MERLISSKPTSPDTISLPDVTAKKLLFDTAFTALKNVISANQAGLFTLIQNIQSLSVEDFDLTPLDISTELRQVPVFIYDLQARAQSLTDDIEKKRIPAVETILNGLAVLSPEDKAKQIEAAAKLILGDEFKMIPRYTIPATQQAEINNSWIAMDDLLSYSKTKEGGNHMNPQEDWLFGIARVHEKMKHIENCILMRQAFNMTDSDLFLHPLQFPFRSEKYHWLALPFKEEDIDLEQSNILLYTSINSEAAGAPTEICGLLVDEWTELIPAREETTGIAFHYDRPNSEAPQTFLLVTPTRLTGNWDWNDLVEALTYTLDAARSRGVEPDQIDKTPFASLLPAILGAESLYPYSIVLDNKAHYMAIGDLKSFDS